MYNLASECNGIGPWNISIGVEGTPNLIVVTVSLVIV